jgi:hypothetical protein
MTAYLLLGRSAAFSAAAVPASLTPSAFFAFVLRSLGQQRRRNLVFRKRGEPLVLVATDRLGNAIHARAHNAILAGFRRSLESRYTRVIGGFADVLIGAVAVG